MLMRPVRLSSKALTTCDLMNFSIYLPVSWEFAEFLSEFMTATQKCGGNKRSPKGCRKTQDLIIFKALTCRETEYNCHALEMYDGSKEIINFKGKAHLIS